MKRRSIAERLGFAGKVLANSMGDTIIRNAVAVYGYDEARMEEGRALYEKAKSLTMQQFKEYGDKYGATKKLKDILKEASEIYMMHVQIARLALRNDYDLYLGLKLKERRERTYDGWLVQAKAFYKQALSSEKILKALAIFRIDQEKLQEGHSLVKAFEDRLHRSNMETGEARNATLQRNKALDEMDQWISDFITICRIALVKSPQDLEKLGIVVKR